MISKRLSRVFRELEPLKENIFYNRFCPVFPTERLIRKRTADLIAYYLDMSIFAVIRTFYIIEVI